VVLVVTGANGFLGRHVVSAALSQRIEVRGCVRTAAASLPAGCEKVVTGEVNGSTDWSTALRGADAVIHCAGLAHLGKKAAAERASEFHAVNVEGTRSLGIAAVRAKVRRVVLVSSIGVNGNRTTGAPFTAADTPRPGTIYGHSKLGSENALLEVAARGGLETVIVRPTLIVGRGAPGNIARLIGLVNSGWVLPLRRVRNRRSLISVEYLSRLLLASARDARASGQLILAAEAPAVSTVEIVAAVGKGCGRPARLIPFPPSWLRLAGRLAGRDSEVSSLCDDLEVDVSAAEDLLAPDSDPEILGRITDAARQEVHGK
jgi:nucleoside-diphosphate-sugar epimerase